MCRRIPTTTAIAATYFARSSILRTPDLLHPRDLRQQVEASAQTRSRSAKITKLRVGCWALMKSLSTISTVSHARFPTFLFLHPHLLHAHHICTCNHLQQ